MDKKIREIVDRFMKLLIRDWCQKHSQTLSTLFNDKPEKIQKAIAYYNNVDHFRNGRFIKHNLLKYMITANIHYLDFANNTIYMLEYVIPDFIYIRFTDSREIFSVFDFSVANNVFDYRDNYVSASLAYSCKAFNNHSWFPIKDPDWHKDLIHPYIGFITINDNFKLEDFRIIVIGWNTVKEREGVYHFYSAVILRNYKSIEYPGIAFVHTTDLV